MNALGLAMVKNEADVIEASIRHNLHFVDLMVVIDNGSSDGTREILQALRREGLPLAVVDEPRFGHFQSERVTAAYRRFVPLFQPDLVYLLDADEFVRADGREALEARLAAVAPGSLGLLPWVTHLPDPAVPDARRLADPLGAMPRRRRREEPTYFKAVIRRDPALDAELVIDQGNHGAHRVVGGRRVALKGALVSGAALAHLPVRSRAQITAKAVVGWHANEARNRQRDVPGEAYQWQQIYERIVRGDGVDEATLVELALGYAQQTRERDLRADSVEEPTPPRYGTLRHLHLGRHDPLAKVALAMEAMLAPASSGDEGTAPDLAAMLDLVDLLQAREVVATTAGRGWLDALKARRPQLNCGSAPAADVLIAPDLGADDRRLLAAQLDRRANDAAAVGGCIVTWPDRARTDDARHAELLDWLARGWAVDLLKTLTLRALAAAPALRAQAVVLRPAADPADARHRLRIDALVPRPAAAREEAVGA